MALSVSEKKLFAICALALAIPLGVGAFYGHINKTPTVSVPPYPAAPQPNGYDLYVQAAKTVTAAKPSAGLANDPEIITDPKIAAQRYGLPRKTAWLAANRAGFAIFDKALQTPTLAPPNRTLNSPFPLHGSLRELARNKLTESDTFWMRGDANGALQSGLDVVQMGHDIRRGGGLIDTLNGIAIGTMGRANNSDTVEKLSAKQAQNAARRLEKLLQTRYDLAQVLTEEKHITQSYWLDIFALKDWRQTDLGSDSLTLSERVRTYTVSKQKIIDDVGAIFDRKIANARLPYAQKGAPPLTLNNPFVEMYQDLGEKMCFVDARDLASDQLLMLQLALRAHRLENGVYPTRLNPLTPLYLKSIPADPFGNGEPMPYKSDGKTYTLWSIGPDAKDDGGTPIPRQKPPRKRWGQRQNLAPVSFESKGDIVAGKNR